MLTFFGIVNFINGVIFAGLGLLVFVANPKQKANQLYAIVSVAATLFTVSYGIWHFRQLDKETALFWIRVMNFGATFIPIIYCHWILTLLGVEKKSINKAVLGLGYFITLILAVSVFTPLYIKDAAPKLFFPYWPVPGLFHSIYFIFCWGGILGYALYCLWKAHKTAAGYKRDQIEFLLIAFLFGFGGGGTNFFLWYDIPVAPWGNLFLFAWGVTLTYAILRYRFMDIRWVLGRTGIYLMAFSVIILYSFLLSFLNQKLSFKVSPLALGIFSSTTSILLFFYLFGQLEKFAAKYFYFTLYSLQATLGRLTEKINQTIKLNELIELITANFSDALKLDKIAIILKHSQLDAAPVFLKVVKAVKLDEQVLLSLLQEQDSFLLQYLSKTKQPLVRDEIPFLLQRKEVTAEDKTKLALFKKDLDNLEIGLLLPLIIEEKLIGIIVLGNKLSREGYRTQELNRLAIFSPQAAVTFNNALSYEEIEKRKEDLERFYNLTVGRELKMIELKEKVEQLEGELKKM